METMSFLLLLGAGQSVAPEEDVTMQADLQGLSTNPESGRLGLARHRNRHINLIFTHLGVKLTELSGT